MEQSCVGNTLLPSPVCLRLPWACTMHICKMNTNLCRSENAPTVNKEALVNDLYLSVGSFISI